MAFNKISNIISIAKEVGVLVVLFLMMWINLFYMHYEVYISNYGAESLSKALLFCTFDVLVPLVFFYLITLGKRKLAFTLTNCFLMLFVLVNIVYSRFFGKYFSFDVINETSNLSGTWWLSYITEMFRWSDVLLVVTTSIFCLCIKHLKQGKFAKDCLAILCLLPLTAFVILFLPSTRERMGSMSSLHSIGETLTGVFGMGKELTDPFSHAQEQTIFKNGILRGQLYCNLTNLLNEGNYTLSEQDRQEIAQYIKQQNEELGTIKDSCVAETTPNIVFILVESYISEASKIKIGNKDVTPNINKLMKQEGVYSNLEMASQRGIGESSDAQISYFTGLIPLQSELSILYILKDSIVGLPHLLHDLKGYNTYITLPTPSYFWHQDEVNKKYGIDNVIDCVNDDSWCNDEELFAKLAKQSLRQPYFNLILTVSMHGSYGDDFLKSVNMKSPFDYPSNFSKEYCYYLDRCYYTDIQIGKYLNHLKQNGTYDNSIIIITSDHQTKANSLNMDVNDTDLPLIIANSGVSVEYYASGNINQIDMYPTLLDLMDLKSTWRGFGHSLLRGNYTSTIEPSTFEISDKMLRGNYFKQ